MILESIRDTFVIFTLKMITLGLSDVRLEYLAEGAANVIYRILPLNSDPETLAGLPSEIDEYDSDTPLPTEIQPLQLDPSLNGKLIRFRKNNPWSAPMEDSQKHFEDMIKPLFLSENLVGAIMFRPSQDLLRDCNSNLRDMERTGRRPPKRHGVYLVEHEERGCLITDMSCQDEQSFKCYEFKPKWLIQSPSAPPGSRRCRTCALRAMNRANRNEATETSRVAFCPLNLVSIDRAKLSLFVDHLLGVDPDRDRTSDADALKGQQEKLMDFLYKNPLLDRLRSLQIDLDPDGVLKADLMSARFLAAMTLRDCTLFLKVGH